MSEELSAIVQELKNSDPEVRENALDKIGTIKPSNALDIILPFLSDVDPEVRGIAACSSSEYKRMTLSQDWLEEILNFC